MPSEELSPSLPERIESTLQAHRMLRRRDTLVVAFSGGPDSTALLHALVELKERLAIELVVAHLDHGQRPDSARDADYCRQQARQLNLSVVTEALPPEPCGEAQLREHRYEFLARQAHTVGARSVATGHTASDSVETLMMNLLRGAGPRGLSGIAPVSSHHGVRILHPLIDVERIDVLRFLATRGASYLEDPTNDDESRLRNRIRHDLLPSLEAIRPGAARA